MSPRRNHPQRDSARASSQPAALDDERTRRGVERVQDHRDGQWLVRNIPGTAAVKPYRCPGCDQEIPAGAGHVVAWPADGQGDATDRRHWHTGCWRARGRREPIVERGRNAPRYGR